MRDTRRAERQQRLNCSSIRGLVPGPEQQQQRHLNCFNIQRIAPGPELQRLERLQHPADLSEGIRVSQWPSRLPAVGPAPLLYSYGSLESRPSLFFDDAGLASMRHSHIDAGPAFSKKPQPARSRARNSKGTMAALTLQPRGPFGRPDARGAIRWMLEQFKCSSGPGAIPQMLEQFNALQAPARSAGRRSSSIPLPPPARNGMPLGP
jgi:hypothetical protein